jgi:6-pyruvoyl-tetrahydropterin synthase
MFELTLEKDFHFAAGHFCAHDAGREFLHGHNYSVSLLIRGLASDDGYVIDFSELKTAVRALCRCVRGGPTHAALAFFLTQLTARRRPSLQ